MPTRHEIRHDRIAQRVFDRAGASLRDRRRVKALVENKMARNRSLDAKLTTDLTELENADSRTGRAYRTANKTLDWMEKATEYTGVFGLFLGWVLRRRERLMRFIGQRFLLSAEELSLVSEYENDIGWADPEAATAYLKQSRENLRARRLGNTILGVTGLLLILAAAGFWYLNRQQRIELNNRLAAYYRSVADTKIEQDSIPLAYRLYREAEKVLPGSVDFGRHNEVATRANFGRFAAAGGYAATDRYLLSTRDRGTATELVLHDLLNHREAVIDYDPAVSSLCQTFGFTPNGKYVYWLGAGGQRIYLANPDSARFDTEYFRPNFVDVADVSGAPPDGKRTSFNNLNQPVSVAWSESGTDLGLVFTTLEGDREGITFYQQFTLSPEGRWAEGKRQESYGIINPRLFADGERTFAVAGVMYESGLAYFRWRGDEFQEIPIGASAAYADGPAAIDHYGRYLIYRTSEGTVYARTGAQTYFHQVPDLGLDYGQAPIQEIRGDTLTTLHYNPWTGNGRYLSMLPEGPRDYPIDLDPGTAWEITMVQDAFRSLEATVLRRDGQMMALATGWDRVEVLRVGANGLVRVRTLRLSSAAAAEFRFRRDLSKVFAFGPGRSYFLYGTDNRFAQFADITGSSASPVADSLGVPLYQNPENGAVYHVDSQFVYVTGKLEGEIVNAKVGVTLPDYEWYVNSPYGREDLTIMYAGPGRSVPLLPVSYRYYFRPGYAAVIVRTPGDFDDRYGPIALPRGYFLAETIDAVSLREFTLHRFPPAGQSLDDMLSETPYFTEWRPGEKKRYGIE